MPRSNGDTPTRAPRRHLRSDTRAAATASSSSADAAPVDRFQLAPETVQPPAAVRPRTGAKRARAVYEADSIEPPPDASQMLRSVRRRLDGEDASAKMTSGVANSESVCWNWVFNGGRNSSAQDPNWAYLYVTQSPYGYVDDRARIDTIARSSPAKAQLDTLRKAYAGRAKPSEAVIQEGVLKALLVHNDLAPKGNSRLKALVWYDPIAPRDTESVPMYRHFEFLYDDQITISKYAGGNVKAYNGEPTFDVDDGAPQPLSVAVAIDPMTLSNDHRAVLAQMAWDETDEG